MKVDPQRNRLLLTIFLFLYFYSPVWLLAIKRLESFNITEIDLGVLKSIKKGKTTYFLHFIRPVNLCWKHKEKARVEPIVREERDLLRRWKFYRSFMVARKELLKYLSAHGIQIRFLIFLENFKLKYNFLSI